MATRAQDAIRETRKLVAEYGGPGVLLRDQVAHALADRDAQIATLRNALRECAEGWRGLVEVTSQYPNWQDDPDAVKAAELAKLAEPKP